MPISIIVGGQYGSEGKGKVAHYFAQKQNAAIAVRCGGSNSGHTVIDPKGIPHVFRHLPTAAILPDVKLALSAGSYLDVAVLQKEILEAQVSSERILIDPYAVIISEKHKEMETEIKRLIGSTASGTGAALLDRIARKDILFAKDCAKLAPYICEQRVASYLREALVANNRIVIEGTQGFGLSVLHGTDYPYVTSRDTTAAGFLAEVGLSPFDVDNVIMVIRSYPIRVAGNSGPLPHETSWSEIGAKINRPELTEFTTVSKNVRRVAEFDARVVKAAIVANKPNVIVLNHLDYIEEDKRLEFIQCIERNIGLEIEYFGLANNKVEIQNG